MVEEARVRTWTTSDLSAGIEATAAWLMTGQEGAGPWMDFRIGPKLIADEWATAYIGLCLQTVKSEFGTVAESLNRARSWLVAREHREGGWGYSDAVASDADSTSLALIFLKREGLTTELDRALRWLPASQNPDGGICTYTYTSIPPQLQWRMRGWCTSQPSITGAALVALGSAADGPFVERALAFLHERFDEGCWPDYWWLEAYYPTYWVVQALQHILGEVPQAGQVREWLLRTQQANGAWGRHGGKAFATALAINTLLLLSDEILPVVRAGVAWLLQAAMSNGGYLPSGEMVFPESYVITFPEGDPLRLGELVTIIPDHRGFFTAATVVNALGQVYQRML